MKDLIIILIQLFCKYERLGDHLYAE
uniref:Battenin isoform x2 n=1 Tax=Triatoma infestans TaxID=30076 RepID=A0A170X3A7_TRIIF